MCAERSRLANSRGNESGFIITGKAPWVEDLWELLRAFPMASHSWFLPARLYTWQGQQAGLRVSVLSHPVRTGLGRKGWWAQGCLADPTTQGACLLPAVWALGGQWGTPGSVVHISDDLRSLGPPAPLPLSGLGHPALAGIRLQTGKRLSARLVGAGRPRAAVSDGGSPSVPLPGGEG